MPANQTSDAEALFCDRCLVELKPGSGNLYVVKIEALADPWPPVITEEDLARDVGAEIDRLLAQAAQMSEQELVDQVYRRLTLYFCNSCYRLWIDNPTG